MKNQLLLVFVVWMTCTLTGCTVSTPEPNKPPPKSSLIKDTSITDVYQVKFVTSKGEFIIEVHPEWAPIGATHFHKLVEAKYYDGCYFFRVIDNFMAQTGINGDPQVNAKWSGQNLEDEAGSQFNKRGYVTFGKGQMPNSRSTHFFVNYQHSQHLDGNGFPPFGKVISGMDVVQEFYSGYDTEDISQEAFSAQGNDYIKKNFPKLDFIKTARIIEPHEKQKKEKRQAEENQSSEKN